MVCMILFLAGYLIVPLSDLSGVKVIYFGAFIHSVSYDRLALRYHQDMRSVCLVCIQFVIEKLIIVVNIWQTLHDKILGFYISVGKKLGPLRV